MKHLVLVILSSAGFIVQAQFLDYNFQEYKQADTRTTWLQLDPVLTGLSQTREPDIFNNTTRTDEFSLRLDLTYGLRQNTRAFQSELILSYTLNPRLSSRENDDGLVVDDTDIRNAFNGSWTRDNYNHSDTWFWGWEVATSSGFTFNRMENSDGFYRNRRVFTLRPEACIRAGHGRIENITNAWHAQRILNRLHFVGMSKEENDYIEINQLGHLIDELKAERVYDVRLNYIAQLRILDDYLRNEFGLSTEDGMKYFVELNDMWSYGISENRIKGQKWTLKFGGLYDLLNQHDEDDDTFDRDLEIAYYGPKLSLSFLRAMPIKRDFQLNVTAEVNSYYLLSLDQFNNKGELMENALIVSPLVNVLLAFYPTTRTEYTLTGTYRNYIRRGELLGTDIISNENESSFTSEGSMRYWFSPRTNLNASISYNYNQSFLDPLFVPETNSWRLFYRVSVSHDFF
jgi:hypothetical protein